MPFASLSRAKGFYSRIKIAENIWEYKKVICFVVVFIAQRVLKVVAVSNPGQTIRRISLSVFCLRSSTCLFFGIGYRSLPTFWQTPLFHPYTEDAHSLTSPSITVLFLVSLTHRLTSAPYLSPPQAQEWTSISLFIRSLHFSSGILFGIFLSGLNAIIRHANSLPTSLSLYSDVNCYPKRMTP